MSTTMLAAWAARLTEPIHAGVLRELGPVDLGDGCTMDAELAARITLADVDDLTERDAADQSVLEDRRQSVAELLDRLLLAPRASARN